MSSSRTVRPSELKLIIMQMISCKRPVFIWGGPGIGKSDVVHEIGQETNRPVIDLRLALMEPTDLRGIPFYHGDKKSMVWAPPAELPTETHNSNAILFLDELNSAPPSVQAAAYQLILNRRIGEYILPKDVVIVAAGNRETDKGVTYRMPAPLANRFVHVNVEHNFEDWQKWAILHGVHADVVGYLSSYKNNLYQFDPKSPDKAFATPRSWKFVSDFLTDSLSEKLLGTLVAGAVGEGMATEFMQHRRVAAKMPKPEDVLSGKVKKLEVKEISARYSLIVNLCYHLREASNTARNPDVKDFTEDDFAAMFDNYLRFMMDNLEVEMIILGARTALATYALPVPVKKLKNMEEFTKKYKGFVFGDG